MALTATITDPTTLDLLPVGTVAFTKDERLAPFTKGIDYSWSNGTDEYDSREFVWLFPFCGVEA